MKKEKNNRSAFDAAVDPKNMDKRIIKLQNKIFYLSLIKKKMNSNIEEDKKKHLLNEEFQPELTKPEPVVERKEEFEPKVIIGEEKLFDFFKQNQKPFYESDICNLSSLIFFHLFIYFLKYMKFHLIF